MDRERERSLGQVHGVILREGTDSPLGKLQEAQQMQSCKPGAQPTAKSVAPGARGALRQCSFALGLESVLLGNQEHRLM